MTRIFVVCVCLVTLALVVGAEEESGWGDATAYGDSDTTPCSCGAVAGQVGALNTFEHIAGVSYGVVGAYFDGAEYPHCTCEKVPEDNWVMHLHQLTISEGDPFPNETLNVEYSSILEGEGLSEQMMENDPSWWWDSLLFTMESVPAVTFFDPDSQEWVAASLADMTVAGSITVSQGIWGDSTSTQGGSTWLSAAADTSLSGGFEATWDPPLTLTVRVKIEYESSAVADGDNCRVIGDRIALSWNLYTGFE